jgi:hypothetical protein
MAVFRGSKNLGRGFGRPPIIRRANRWTVESLDQFGTARAAAGAAEEIHQTSGPGIVLRIVLKLVRGGEPLLFDAGLKAI